MFGMLLELTDDAAEEMERDCLEEEERERLKGLGLLGVVRADLGLEE